jgi:putative phosphoesterase
MLIGVFSDVHDHLEHLARALARFRERNIESLIFCGDFCSPIPARVMAAYEGDVHCVFGNGDGDPFTIAGIAREQPHLKVHGPHAELELGGASIAVTHYPLYGRALARTGDYRAVFSGHTHEARIERIGGCLWVNPGEILGWKGPPTCAIYDSDRHEIELIEL